MLHSVHVITMKMRSECIAAVRQITNIFSTIFKVPQMKFFNQPAKFLKTYTILFFHVGSFPLQVFFHFMARVNPYYFWCMQSCTTHTHTHTHMHARARTHIPTCSLQPNIKLPPTANYITTCSRSYMCSSYTETGPFHKLFSMLQWKFLKLTIMFVKALNQYLHFAV